MNKFDDYIKEKANEESIEVPENVSKAVENALASLPETNKSASKIKIFPKILSTAACVVFFFLVLMPNFSKAYAKSLADVPVIGKIVKLLQSEIIFIQTIITKWISMFLKSRTKAVRRII